MWNKFPYYGQFVWENYLKEQTFPDTVSDKITQVEHFPSIRR